MPVCRGHFERDRADKETMFRLDDRYGCFWIALKCFYEEHQQQQQYLLKAVPPQQQSSTFSSPSSKHQSSPTVPQSQLNSSSSFSKSPFFNSMSSQALNDSSGHLLNNTIASEMNGKDKGKQEQERSFKRSLFAGHVQLSHHQGRGHHQNSGKFNFKSSVFSM